MIAEINIGFASLIILGTTLFVIVPAILITFIQHHRMRKKKRKSHFEYEVEESIAKDKP